MPPVVAELSGVTNVISGASYENDPVSDPMSTPPYCCRSGGDGTVTEISCAAPIPEANEHTSEEDETHSVRSQST